MEVRADYNSGIAYVQYDQPHHDAVVAYVTDFSEQYHAAQGHEEFPSPPLVVNNPRSVQSTMDARTSAEPPAVDPSLFDRFDNRYDTAEMESAPSVSTPRSLPNAIITMGRPFSQVVTEGNQTQATTTQDPTATLPADDESQASSLAKTASNCSTKSREELLQENVELRTIIRDQTNRIQSLEQAFQQFLAQHAHQGSPPPQADPPPVANPPAPPAGTPPPPPKTRAASSRNTPSQETTTVTSNRSSRGSKKNSFLEAAAGDTALPPTNSNE